MTVVGFAGSMDVGCSIEEVMDSGLLPFTLDEGVDSTLLFGGNSESVDELTSRTVDVGEPEDAGTSELVETSDALGDADGCTATDEDSVDMLESEVDGREGTVG